MPYSLKQMQDALSSPGLTEEERGFLRSEIEKEHRRQTRTPKSDAAEASESGARQDDVSGIRQMEGEIELETLRAKTAAEKAKQPFGGEPRPLTGATVPGMYSPGFSTPYQRLQRMAGLGGPGSPEANELSARNVKAGLAGALVGGGAALLGPAGIGLRAILADTIGGGLGGATQAVAKDAPPKEIASEAGKGSLFSLALGSGLQGPLLLARNRAAAAKADLDIGPDYTAAKAAGYRPAGTVKGTMKGGPELPPLGQHAVTASALDVARTKVRPEIVKQDEGVTASFRGPAGTLTKALKAHEADQIDIGPLKERMLQMGIKYEGIPGAPGEKVLAEGEGLPDVVSPQKLEDYIDVLQKQANAAMESAGPEQAVRMQLARELEDLRPDWLKEIAARERAAIADIKGKKQLLGWPNRKRVYEGEEAGEFEAAVGVPDPVVDRSIQKAISRVGQKGEEVTTEALEKLAKDSGDPALAESIKKLKGQLAAERLRMMAGGGESMAGKSVASGTGGGARGRIRLPLGDRLSRLNWLWDGGKWTPVAEAGAAAMSKAGAAGAVSPGEREELIQYAKGIGR